MAGTANQVHLKAVSEVRNVAVSFVDMLDDGELLTGTPTVTCTGLTLASKAVNTVALTIDGVEVEIGQAVQFKVSGGTALTQYTIEVQCDTDATPAQTLRLKCKLDVEADA